MMDESLGAAIVTIIKANATASALVGSRIYPRRLPQGEGRQADGRIRPCVVYGGGATTEFDNHLRGTQQDAVCSCPVVIVASTDAEAKRAASAVRYALHAHKGTYGDVRIRATIVQSQTSEEFEPGETGGDAGYYVETLTVSIHHTLTLPVEVENG